MKNSAYPPMNHLDKMYIKKFKDLSKDDVATVGGKGASLGEMTKAGLPIPQGFVITTKAFIEFQNEPFIENFKKEVFAAFNELGSERVAVRSSAVAEDSSSASWAGQLESYLNVASDDLLESILQCFKSINSKRAKAYAKDKKVTKKDLTVAVVIQKMIDSEISGVMFTGNPVTENKNEIVIEAGYGLGELVVQGVITPDNYVVDNNNFSIKSKSLGSKEKMYVFKDGKNAEALLSKKLKDKFTLSEIQVKELSKLGKKIENHYGFPCDIEWAFSKGKFYITQSRPITTLPLTTEATNIPKWDNAELFRWGPMPGKFFYISDYVEAAAQLKQYLGESFPGTLLLFHNVQMIWICVQKEMTEIGSKIFIDYVMDRNNMARWHKDFNKALKELGGFQKKLGVQKVNKFSKNELEKTMEEFYRLVINFWLPTIPPELGNYGSTDVLRKNLANFIKSDKELDEVIQTLTTPEKISYNQQEEIDLSVAADLKKHLSNYFWLQNNYSGSRVLNMQFFEKRKNDLDKNLKEKVEQKIKKIKEEKQAIIKRYNLPKTIVNMSNIIWQNIIWQDTRKKLSLLTHYYRFILLNRAANLLGVKASVLEDYSYKDIIETLSNGRLIKNAKQEYSGTTIINNLTKEEAEVAWNAFTKAEINKSQKNFLAGIVASKGNKRLTVGKVKVVLDPRITDEFPPGSILVTPTTSPEFVILMRKSVAVVTNTGGLTSHAAIVSRELGIPCIVGTKFATEVLKDGDLIKVDTNKGSITKV